LVINFKEGKYQHIRRQLHLNKGTPEFRSFKSCGYSIQSQLINECSGYSPNYLTSDESFLYSAWDVVYSSI